ncbi:MAG: hypothetical protein ACFFDN_16235 [Candidatus Hodarchaeota archaeon]
MTEQEFIHDSESLAREKDMEEKLANFLKENQGSAFTIRALNNKLEDIINDTNELEIIKENFEEILNKMKSNGKIDTIEHNGENHYLIKKSEKAAPEQQKVKLEPIKQWINVNRGRITGWVMLFGLLIGLVSLLVSYSSEILISLSVIFITVSILIEIITTSRQSKENLKYHPPTYGILALVFSIIGLIILINPGNIYYISFQSLYVTPLFIAAMICGAAGFYFNKDTRPVAALLGLFLGMILFIISIWPVLYYIFGYAAFFLSGGW